MSLHCPTCGAADDGSINGYACRAHRAEAHMNAARALIIDWRDEAKLAHSNARANAFNACADELESSLDRLWP